MNIYYPWRDLVNQPLMTETVLRPQPFFQFKFTTRPSMTQGTALTPQKVGLAYCWMLFTTLQRDSWPGHVRGVIFEGNNQRRIDVGSVRVDNDPNVAEQATAGPGATLPATADPNAAEPVPADPGADSTGGLSAWFRFEQRWARCFTTSLQLPIVHYPQHLVMDDPAFAPKPGIQTHRFPCRSSGLADRLDLFIYPAAYAPSPQQLTWDRMMKFLINWNTKVAAGREDGRRTQFVEGNVLIAEISVYLQPGIGENEWEGFSVAPA
ncbi:MAG: hypothetical protein L6R35_003107 [Caloplaca aegaea]|nr:MAG: hypothetical protein L6R35_003107 [Caloplaca aegaea]